MRTSFKSKLLGAGNNTGLQVPEATITELNAGKRPPVAVNVNGYQYKSTVAVMNGNYMIPFSKAHREATGLKAGDAIHVTLELDDGVREVEIPTELQAALDRVELSEAFGKLAYSKRKEFARQVSDAKAEETRNRRIQKIFDQLS